MVLISIRDDHTARADGRRREGSIVKEDALGVAVARVCGGANGIGAMRGGLRRDFLVVGFFLDVAANVVENKVAIGLLGEEESLRELAPDAPAVRLLAEDLRMVGVMSVAYNVGRVPALEASCKPAKRPRRSSQTHLDDDTTLGGTLRVDVGNVNLAILQFEAHNLGVNLLLGVVGKGETTPRSASLVRARLGR